MRIELTKKITVKVIEVIAEVNFFIESPYIELLKDFNHQSELEKELSSYELTNPAISNIIKRLEHLGVLKNGTIVNLKDGFPERELGKYRITYYENDTSQPFKFHIKEIERVEAVSQNIADEIKPIDKQLINQLNKDNNQSFKTNHRFQVLKIIDGKGHFIEALNDEEDLYITFSDDKWEYKLKDKRFNIENGIDFNELFEGKWIEADKLCEEDFEEIKNNKKALEQFKRDYSQKQDIPEWGSFSSRFQNISIAPNKETREKWFIHLLSEQIISEKHYFSQEDLEQKWNNLFYTTSQINRLGKLPYNYEQIIKVFNKTTETYWLIQAGTDLNPFNNTLFTKTESNFETTIIKEQHNVPITTALQDLHLEKFKSLTIIDKYINTKRHFEVLFLLKSHYSNLDVKIISTENYKTSKSDIQFIENGCKNHSIERIIKKKNEIPHDRHWKLDSFVYNVSKSIDFIYLDKREYCCFKHTVFTLLDNNEIESQAKKLLRGTINE